jgi:hypothetical protein
MIILGLDTSTINWYLVLYVVLSIVFLVYGTKAVYPTGEIRGVIFAIGTALVLFYFGLKWFGTPEATLTQWPPVINMCPDYLTFVPSIKSSSTATTTIPGCVDMLGVSKSGVLHITTSSALTSLTRSENSSPGANYKVFPYSSTDITTATAAGGTSGTEKIQEICNACQTAGITWEGVFDGDTCIALNSYNNSKGALEKCLLSV